jgi:hypothetical protein
LAQGLPGERLHLFLRAAIGEPWIDDRMSTFWGKRDSDGLSDR